ncbi:MAG: efflux RND transporter permease subunit [Chthonomonadales bacterium]|nr:efflux RND transporter permease subunit [Chthonomonadales bacterium]
MVNRIVEFSVRERLVIVILAALLVVGGLWAFQRLPIDALPDVTNNQVQINTTAPGMAPAEVERLVTFPIEVVLGGLPDVAEVRSLSQYGLSQVTVVFADRVDTYFARQLVLEKLTTAREGLPAGVGTPEMAPISTGLGEIYQYTLDSDQRSPTELRTLQDWLVKPQLRTTPGIAEVNSQGGHEKQFHVEIDPQKLLARGVTLRDVIEAVESNNANAGGGYIVKGPEQLLVRGVGVVRGAEDISNIVVAAEHGTPIHVHDVARVSEGRGTRQGAATHNGKETVLGIAMMLKGGNSRTVALAVDSRVREVRKQLPPDVRLATVYNRTDLVEKTIGTVRRNLLEGGALVVAVLLFLLGNLRGALIVASAIPLSMLFAIIGMERFGISANLLSLGAIDFGMIVDGSVVLVENAVRRVAEAREHAGRTLSRAEVTQTVLRAAREVGAPLTFGVAIIILVYLPIMTLTGIEGKMFRPMAYTVAFALFGALLLTLTFIPVLCAMLLSGNTREKQSPVIRVVERLYAWTLEWALRRRLAVVGASVLLFVGCALLLPRLGSEFLPRLDEGALAIQPIRPPGVSVDYSVAMCAAAESVVKSFPEVEGAFTRIGSAELATDPMPPSIGDMIVPLKDRRHWRRGMTRERLVAEMAERLEHEVPGQAYAFSQPIQLRTDELVSGVKADIAAKVFGDDMGTLEALGARIRAALARVPGATDVTLEQTTGLPMLEITVNRGAAARHGVNVSDVQEVVETYIGGRGVGQVIDGERRFDIVVKLPEALRNDLDVLSSLRVSAPNGAQVPLATVAQISIRPAPAQVSREHGRRRVVVQCNVRGRDLGTFAADAQARIAREVKLPTGYYVEWGGQFENLQSARQRLLVVVPLALGLIFGLLFMAFDSLKQAALIFTGVPLAVTGGVLALWARGLPFSISAAVGFIALFGVAVLNGVVMVAAINELRKAGRPVPRAVREGARLRLRPVLMTALVASLGFVPMALSTGVGAEVQRPLATVVVGGILSSTLLTLVVLPVLYAWFEGEAG